MRRISITTRNDAFQILCSFRDNRKKRSKRGVVYVEGVAPINTCVDQRIAVESVVYSAGRRLSGWATETIRRLSPETAFELDPTLMAELSERGEPSELIVIARRPERSLSDLEAVLDLPGSGGLTHRDPVFLVLDRPSNHGNLGSILRSADAFSVTGVVVTGHSVDIYAPAVIRSSLGACFTTPLVFEPSMLALTRWIEGLRPRFVSSGRQMQVLATDSNGDTPLPTIPLSPPLVLLFGNEATGVSSSLLELADGVVSIPIAGAVNSLNLACAASVFLYKVSTERMAEHTEN